MQCGSVCVVGVRVYVCMDVCYVCVCVRLYVRVWKEGWVEGSDCLPVREACGAVVWLPCA